MTLINRNCIHDVSRPNYAMGLMISLVILFIPDSVNGDDWGHWRGPTGNGSAPNASPPTQFSATKNVKWKVPVAGRGSSSPIVSGNTVFLTTAVGTSGGTLDFQLIALERDTGKVRWQRSAVKAKPHESTHETNGFASASPCTDGEWIYAFFGSRGVYCYDFDGQLIWSRDLGDMRIRNGFGEGASPTIAENSLIVPWDHEGKSSLFALNRKTGETVWETPRNEPTNWSTPLIAEDKNGVKQVVMNGQNAARGYDLKTGKELWSCTGQTERPCASAVASDGIAYVGSGHRGSYMGAFDIAGRGDLNKAGKVIWTLKKDTPDVASPLFVGGRIYFYKAKSGQLSCVDAKSGKTHFSAQRLPGIDTTYASPVAGGGYIFLCDRKGGIVVIRDSNQLEIISENKLDGGIDATPAISGKQLFVRTEDELYCFES